MHLSGWGQGRGWGPRTPSYDLEPYSSNAAQTSKSVHQPISTMPGRYDNKINMLIGSKLWKCTNS